MKCNRFLQCIVWYRCKLSGLMQCAACASVAAGVFLVLLMVDRATARKRFFCPLPLAAMAWRLRSPVFRRGEKVFQFQSLSWSIFIIMLIPLKCLAAIGTNPLGWRFLTRWNWIPFMQEWGARTLEPQSSFSKKKHRQTSTNLDKHPLTTFAISYRMFLRDCHRWRTWSSLTLTTVTVWYSMFLPVVVKIYSK